jgi:hypothetical protein
MATSENSVIIALTETWLTENHQDAEVRIPGFNLFRADRVGKSHGGAALYIREDFAAVPILTFSENGVEAIVLKVRDLEAIVFAVYRPPSTTSQDFEPLLVALEESILLAQAHSNKFENVLGFGDFNFPNIKWGSSQPGLAEVTVTGAAERFLSFTEDLFLSQLITEVTRGNNILDLVLTNHPELVSHFEVRPNIKLSDHSSILIYLSSTDAPTKPDVLLTNRGYTSRIPSFDISKGTDEDWIRYSAFLDTSDWMSVAADLTLEDKISLLTNHLESAVEKIFPLKQRKAPGNRIPLAMRKLMTIRRKTGLKLLRTKCPTALLRMREELIRIESVIESSHTAVRLKAEVKVTNDIKQNPAAFFKYASKFCKAPCKVGPLLDLSGKHTCEESSMADILGKHYSTMYSEPRHSLTEELIESTFVTDPDSQSPTLTDISFNPVSVREALGALSNSAAPGPDGIPSLCLKRGGQLVISALVDIFTMSMEEGVVDESMRRAFISPIYKGGDRALAVNYRPVALSTHLCKTMERVMRGPIVDFLDSSGQLDQSQHGARAGRSTLTQLLVHYDMVLKMIESGSNCELVYLDFSKAFDKVDHSILLQKLAKMGIKGKVGRWIGSFLHRRMQAVRVGSTLSDWLHVISGVPQGTVLGPLLFLCFIADLGDNLGPGSAVLLKYVDDTKVVKEVNSMEDMEALQVDLEALYDWQVTNNMEWNGDKFQSLRMGHNQTLRNESLLFTPNYTDPIPEKDVVKDLGVFMERDGTFGQQRFKANAKAHQKAGWVLRTFKSQDLATLKTLWSSLIRPHQDYCSQLWSPVSSAGDLLRQEAPLRAFTKRIKGFSALTYWERLAEARMYSTERRQERYKMIYSWKALRGLVPNCGLVEDSPVSSRRGRTISIPSLPGSERYRAVKTLRDHSFQSEGPKLFNSLPKEIRNLETTADTFKLHLDKFLETIPDHPAVPGHIPAAQRLSGQPSNSVRDWSRRILNDSWMTSTSL